MDIGFIGLGQMGHHMARRLVEAGHRVTVLDTRREAVDRLVALGAQAGTSPRAIADAVETVMAKRIFDLLQAKNIVQIDCPVSGGTTGAAKGTLALMVSGPRSEVKAIEPLLPPIGKFFFIGEQPGAGQTMKLCNNFLSAAAMTATSEA